MLKELKTTTEKNIQQISQVKRRMLMFVQISFYKGLFQ
jgi:hypothetical protein